MYKFAHIGDCHLGAFREQSLRNLNLEAFERAIDGCIMEKVDFVIISGDLFDTSHPSLDIVARCVKKLKEVKEHNIPLYLIYGSHDYNVGKESIIDILSYTGLFVRLPVFEEKDGKIKLDFVTDEKTGAKITGMFGMPNGREVEYYQKFDLKHLEAEKGFKIFILHSAVSEYKPVELESVSAIPLSMLPKGFDYYAAGHIHKRFVADKKGYGKLVFPGILLGSSWPDLEQDLTEKTGYFVVAFDEKGVKSAELREIKVCDIELVTFDVKNKTATEARDLLNELIEKKNVENKIILLKISGEISSGEIVDLELYKARRKILDKGAIEVYMNSRGLSVKEAVKLKINVDESMKFETVENMIFKELINSFKTHEKMLAGNNGVLFSERLLKILREPRKEGETKQDYAERIMEPTRKALAEIQNET